MRKIFFIIFFVLLILFGIVWKNFLTTPLIPPGQPFDYVFKNNSSVRELAADLNANGVLAKPNFLIVLAYVKGVARQLKAGEYLFAPGTTPGQLLDQMAAGRVFFHRFTIVEGWTVKQVLLALQTRTDVVHTLNTVMAAEAVQKMGLPPQNPEGLLFPATYYFHKGMTDVGLLRMAYHKMAKTLPKVWQQRASNLLYQSPYQALIVASLVEKETAQPQERPIVAGVILRRLKLGMPLQIDATLVYGLGDYPRRLDRTALRQDTPYNTYLHRGLPPTPIALPSLQSLQAATHPDGSDALYFVAKGDGTHQFSATLTAQNHAVTLYQVDPQLPKVGKKEYSHSCPWFWYTNTFLQKLCLLF